MKLVKYNSNWADEMDIEGFKLFTDKRWKEYQKRFEEYFVENIFYNFYIGTNEEIEYESFVKFMKDFEVIEITDKEAKTIKKFFDKTSGFFPEI